MSNYQLIAVLFTGFVDYLGIGLVYPVFASLLFDPNYSILAADSSMAFRGGILGILIALAPISQFFFAPILGAFSDRKGRKIALILGITTGCVGYCFAVMGIWAHSLSLLCIYCILVGVSDGTASVAQATIADISTGKNKTRRFALLNSSLGLGFTIGPFLGGKLADPTFIDGFGYATPFIAAGLLSLTNLLMILWKFPETHKGAGEGSFNLFAGLKGVSKVFLWHHLRWLFIGGFSLSFGWTFFYEFAPVFLRDRFQFNTSSIGDFYAYSGGCYAIGAMIVASPIFKNFSTERLVVLSLAGGSLGMFFFAGIQEARTIWWNLPLIMFFLAIVYTTATTLVSDRTDHEHQGEVLGAFLSVQGLAMGLSPLFVGSAVGAYPVLAPLGGALSLAISGMSFWMSFRKRK